jgi:hypothetical protein
MRLLVPEGIHTDSSLRYTAHYHSAKELNDGFRDGAAQWPAPFVIMAASIPVLSCQFSRPGTRWLHNRDLSQSLSTETHAIRVAGP